MSNPIKRVGPDLATEYAKLNYDGSLHEVDLKTADLTDSAQRIHVLTGFGQLYDLTDEAKNDMRVRTFGLVSGMPEGKERMVVQKVRLGDGETTGDQFTVPVHRVKPTCLAYEDQFMTLLLLNVLNVWGGVLETSVHLFDHNMIQCFVNDATKFLKDSGTNGVAPEYQNDKDKDKPKMYIVFVDLRGHQNKVKKIAEKFGNNKMLLSTEIEELRDMLAKVVSIMAVKAPVLR